MSRWPIFSAPKRRSFPAIAPRRSKPSSTWRRNAETRLLGLRGLHVEAQRRGDHDAAIHYAQEAHKIAPLPWSAKAVLEHRAAHSDWQGALAALESQIAAKLVDKHTGERQRAVLQTAIALDEAERAPDDALRLAREALAHAPDLVPASVLAARILSYKGEVRRAAKMIETAWSRQRHPELAETFLDLRSGDPNADRLAKAQTLAKFAPNDPESRMIVARAALAARDFPNSAQGDGAAHCRRRAPQRARLSHHGRTRRCGIGRSGAGARMVGAQRAGAARSRLDCRWRDLETVGAGLASDGPARCLRLAKGRQSASAPISMPTAKPWNGRAIGPCRGRVTNSRNPRLRLSRRKRSPPPRGAHHRRDA